MTRFGSLAPRKTWTRYGMVDKAISMFIELRQWEEAKVFVASSGGMISGQDLTRRQAEWAEEASKAQFFSIRDFSGLLKLYFANEASFLEAHRPPHIRSLCLNGSSCHVWPDWRLGGSFKAFRSMRGTAAGCSTRLQGEGRRLARCPGRDR